MPLIFLLLLLVVQTSLSSNTFKQPFTIMLDGAGDAHHAGRTLAGDYLERGLTMQLAQGIKHKLEQTYDGLRVVLARTPGESATHIQRATFANRIADLYISISLYPQTTKPTIDCYYFCLEPRALPIAPTNNLQLTPLTQVHLPTTPASQASAQAFYTELKNIVTNTMIVHMPTGIPCAPLKGIACPAFALEASIKHAHDIPMLVNILSSALTKSIDYHIRNQS